MKMTDVLNKRLTESDNSKEIVDQVIKFIAVAQSQLPPKWSKLDPMVIAKKLGVSYEDPSEALLIYGKDGANAVQYLRDAIPLYVKPAEPKTYEEKYMAATEMANGDAYREDVESYLEHKYGRDAFDKLSVKQIAQAIKINQIY